MTGRRARPEPSRPRPTRSRSRPLRTAVCTVAGVALLLLPPACDDYDPAKTFQTASVVLPAPSREEAMVLDRFAEIAEIATEAVVRIERRAPPSVRPTPSLEMPELFEPFFGPPGGPGQPGVPFISGGSGVIVSTDGHVLTNAHVAMGGGDLTVWLNDRRSFRAVVVGTDPTTDVALLDIDADDLPTLPLGDSDELRVGNWVLAIGSPGLGGGQLEQTVTSGIVSALGRPLQLLSRDLLQDPETQELAGYAIENFIQTDAVINPGNSGGPLLDMQGRVVGINTAIASPTGYYLGYGFAIPSNLAAGVIEDLVEFGEVRRARLGVRMTTITPEDAEFFDLKDVSGVLVQGVTQGGPADEAGIRQGDVIVSVDGEPISGSGGLQQEVAERSPGDRVELGIVRDGRGSTVSVELDEADLPTAAEPVEPAASGAAERLGLQLGELTPERRSEIGYDTSTDGVLVLDVLPLSPAYLKGIQAGQVVLEMDGEPLTSPEDLATRLSALEPGQVTALLVAEPDAGEMLITLRIPE